MVRGGGTRKTRVRKRDKLFSARGKKREVVKKVSAEVTKRTGIF